MEVTLSKREAFLQAVGKETVQEFLHFIEIHKNAFDPFDLEELLEELPRKQKEELWQKLKTLLTDILGENPVETWNRIIDDSDDDMEVEGASDMKRTMDVIHGVTTVATLSVSAVEDDTTYTALLECTAILNELLNALPISESRVRVAIQHLCETWWKKGLEGKEEFGKTAILLLLAKSLDAKRLVADITRLWQLHSSLLSFDYTSAESSDVKNLLLQCFRSINHIRREEGRRFLSFLFSLDVNFIKIIHATIKDQLPCFPKSVMNHIAEIYFRAWAKGSGDILTTIEHVCIQDLMHHGVHLPKKSPVHPKVRMILTYFHRQKLRQGVQEMLNRLYQPILWRGLKNLLEDPAPNVRTTGVFGVCKISAKYWEMIPPLILADFMKKILGDLAADISSADVRASVFKCLLYILDNKLSHPLLEQMLPLLQNSLHDTSEKVRVAFVEMLLKIKAVRATKFWMVCPMDHLLARLEIDSRPVCQRLVKLMFNSFFPVNEPEDVWCERCVALVQMNPAAARRFYQYTYEHTAPTNIAKLMLTIRRCLNACLQKAICNADETNNDGEEVDNDGNESENGKKTNKSVLENVLSTEDVTSIASLIEIVVILWQSIKKALDQNEESKNYTISKFASVLPDYFRVFKDERCTVALIILASFMPPSAVPTFSCSVLSKLRNLQNGVEENKYATLIDCLCRWGQVGHILELISDWLSESFPEKKKQKNSGRQVRIQDTMESKPELALDYMEYIMTHTMNREYLLSVQTKRLNGLLKVLGLVKEVLCSFMKPSDNTVHKITPDTALRAFSLYCRLSIHLQYKFSSEGRIYLSLLEDTATWIKNQVLALLGSREISSDEQIDLSLEILKTYLTICKDLVMVGLADSGFHAQILQTAISTLQVEKTYTCLPVLISLLKEITEVCLAQKMSITSTDLDNHFDAIQTIFHKSLETAARRLRKQQDEALQLLQSIQVPLGHFIYTVQCWHTMAPELHRGMLSTIIAASVVEISHSLRKLPDPSEIPTPTSVSDLPPLSRCLIAIVVKTSNVLSSFIGELAECIAVGEIEGIQSLTASLYIIMVSSKGKAMSAAAKNTASIIHRKLKTYREITMEDDDNLERAIYESSVKTLDQLLLA
ncbi:condensin-2 complex subunit G2 isoform 2-T2 [Anomaloglossus baeobatrachus]|uniref:condensin-2 complex subunit G2 isoform X2 n=1 Tax=Anomaloglossus baeobatrachus TaxID=238106 RepID=UPI003F50BE10